MNSDFIRMNKTDNEILKGIIRMVSEIGFAICEYQKGTDYTIYISRGLDFAIFKRYIKKEELSEMLDKYLSGEYELLESEPENSKSRMGAYASSIGKTIDDGAVLIKMIQDKVYCCFAFEM